MMKQYFKQAWYMLKENRLVSCISIIGTAISIAMIMVVVLIFQIQYAGFSPENNRDRMLYVDGGTEVRSKDGNNWNRGNMSDEAVRECFYSLKLPEAASAYARGSVPLSIPGKRMYKAYSIKYTDPGFWKIFSFRFLAGKPFTQADFDSAIPAAVISRSVAQKLYGTTEVVSKPVLIDLTEYTICGVVEDVSRAADTASSDVWIPYTADPVLLSNTYKEHMSGVFSVCLLARSRQDFEPIRQELKGQIARYNASKKDYEIGFFHNPITRFDIAIGTEGQNKVELKSYIAETGGLLLFLLLVPALNLLGVTYAAVQKRRSEMGVRKAFGATNGTLIRQILYENCLITLMGGCIGLLLSFLLLPVCKDFLLQKSDALLNGDMVFQPTVFVVALLFSLLLNLLSAGLPALRLTRQQIVSSLKDNEEV